jgi:hypothetical protein
MPKVTMPKDHPSAALTIAGQRVERGKTVEVDEETAVSLAEQGWTVAAKKSTSTTPEASEDADTKEKSR